MILALLVCNWHLIQLAAILYFANMAAPWGACLDARQKSKQYDMGDLWVKFGAFGRIWNQISLPALTSTNCNVQDMLGAETLVLVHTVHVQTEIDAPMY